MYSWWKERTSSFSLGQLWTSYLSPWLIFLRYDTITHLGTLHPPTPHPITLNGRSNFKFCLLLDELKYNEKEQSSDQEPDETQALQPNLSPETFQDVSGHVSNSILEPVLSLVPIPAQSPDTLPKIMPIRWSQAGHTGPTPSNFKSLSMEVILFGATTFNQKMQNWLPSLLIFCSALLFTWWV